MFLLDTDILIDVQRGHSPALAWFADLAEVPSVPGFVVMELIQDARDARQVREALRLIAPLPIVWPTTTDCQHALADFTAYHLSHGLGLLDALIGACGRVISGTVYLQHQILSGHPGFSHHPAVHAIARSRPQVASCHSLFTSAS